jgi:membrane-associated phospholipid phosphatase
VGRILRGEGTGIRIAIVEQLPIFGRPPIRVSVRRRWILLAAALPSYPSGHSVVSAASAAVIAEFMSTERAHVESMAQEAAMSRLLAGIHNRFDNETGLDMGRKLGQLVLDRIHSDAPGSGR